MSSAPAGPLGDTSQRDYAHKLRLFNRFAEPELRTALDTLSLTAGMRVLDAGCGTGESLAWLAAAVAPHGLAIGVDLASAHVRAAREMLPQAALLQADLMRPSLAKESFDLVWSVNTIHHLHDPGDGARTLATLLRPGGRLALGQSSLLPDMYFAWDARLERATNEAVRAYYRDRYRITEQELTSLRCLLGVLREAGLTGIQVRTFLIERVAPLEPGAEAWLLEAVFRGTWGERLRPYLSPDDYQQLSQLADPGHASYALRRADFHFLQTFTLAVGTKHVSMP
ncbi:MAG: methyltransferase domain-containing protein [Gammaproteobacteria bacterium]|nr:methyltransferase domain-containing protein [Gammaproteobacteria bacterium]